MDAALDEAGERSHNTSVCCVRCFGTHEVVAIILYSRFNEEQRILTGADEETSFGLR